MRVEVEEVAPSCKQQRSSPPSPPSTLGLFRKDSTPGQLGSPRPAGGFFRIMHLRNQGPAGYRHPKGRRGGSCSKAVPLAAHQVLGLSEANSSGRPA